MPVGYDPRACHCLRTLIVTESPPRPGWTVLTPERLPSCLLDQFYPVTDQSSGFRNDLVSTPGGVQLAQGNAHNLNFLRPRGTTIPQVEEEAQAT